MSLTRQAPITAPLITIQIDSIDRTLGMIESLGGRTVRERMPVGDLGFAAYFADTEDNILGLWETGEAGSAA